MGWDMLLFVGVLAGAYATFVILILSYHWASILIRERGKDYKELKKLRTMIEGKGEPKNLVAVELYIIKDLMWAIEERNEALGMREIITILGFIPIFIWPLFASSEEESAIIEVDMPLGWLIVIFVIIWAVYGVGIAYHNSLSEKKYCTYSIQWRIASMTNRELNDMTAIQRKVYKNGTINEMWMAYLISQNKEFFEKDFDIYRGEAREILDSMVRCYYDDKIIPYLPFTIEYKCSLNIR
jgi:hypothetical protein